MSAISSSAKTKPMVYSTCSWVILHRIADLFVFSNKYMCSQMYVLPTIAMTVFTWRREDCFFQKLAGMWHYQAQNVSLSVNLDCSSRSFISSSDATPFNWTENAKENSLNPYYRLASRWCHEIASETLCGRPRRSEKVSQDSWLHALETSTLESGKIFVVLFATPSVATTFERPSLDDTCRRVTILRYPSI